MNELENILNSVQKYNKKADLEIIKKAFNFSYEKHKEQKRLSGDDYFIHPLSVVKILVELEMDVETITAAFLHDILEDTNIKKKELEEKFGANIAFLVEGVTTLGEIDFSKIPGTLEDEDPKVQSDIENLRKLFLAMAQDLRVVIIKLADRLHNMRTIKFLPRKGQTKNSRETLEIFAPLADRLGIGQVKAELEDLSFECLLPDEYKNLEKKIKQPLDKKNEKMIITKRTLSDLLKKEKIKYLFIDGRVKHLYSLYRKLQKVDGDIDKVYDLVALRIVVNSISDCYKVLGIVHKRFKPLIYKIKDYIAIPKPNGYQSLHTTVFGTKGEITEIQIRTKEMHEEAENGIAAHWYYSESKSRVYKKGQVSFAPKDKASWIKELMDIQKEVENPKDFINTLKIDIFNDRIFTFSPDGELLNLPESATPVDFSYAVHSWVGDYCVGAKVNNHIVNLDYKLSNRDVVEILTSEKSKGPSRKWLDFVVTSKAKQRIRSFLREFDKESNLKSGRKELEEELSLLNTSISDLDKRKLDSVLSELPYNNLEDLLVAIGEGFFTTSQFIKKFFRKSLYSTQKKSSKGLKVQTGLSAKKLKEMGLSDIKTKRANCCLPKNGDSVVYYITKGYGLSIHKVSCKNIKRFSKDRLINSGFKGEELEKIKIIINIKAKNRVGLLKDIATLVSSTNINIGDIKSNHKKGTSNILMNLEGKSIIQIQKLMKKILTIKGVDSIKKIG